MITRVSERSDGSDANTLIDEHLARFESLFADFLSWLPRLYEPESGGFYYAISSRTERRFHPDIESTCFALRSIDETVGVSRLPLGVREHLAGFFHSRQDPDTGFYFDPHNGMRSVERMRGRALSDAQRALALVGEVPLRPLPSIDQSALLDHLRSPEAFRTWLDGRPWDNSWLAQDNIQAQAPLIKLLPPEQQSVLVDTALSYVERLQETDTGMVGGGTPYVRVSGAFKLALFCRAFGRPVPLAPAIYATTLECIRNEVCEDACWLRNPVELIEVLEPQLGALPEADVADIVRISATNAREFLRDDGGFSRKRGFSSSAPNEIQLGLGLAEGDLNASVQLVTIVRPALYRLIGRTPPPMAGHESWSLLRSSQLR